MTVQVGLCPTCSETTLLVFPEAAHFFKVNSIAPDKATQNLPYHLGLFCLLWEICQKMKSNKNEHLVLKNMKDNYSNNVKYGTHG